MTDTQENVVEELKEEEQKTEEQCEELPPQIQRICDHSELIHLCKIIEDRLYYFDSSLTSIAKEVVHYPKSGHPKYMPNQIAVSHMCLKDLISNFSDLCSKIQENKYVEVEINDNV